MLKVLPDSAPECEPAAIEGHERRWETLSLQILTTQCWSYVVREDVVRLLTCAGEVVCYSEPVFGGCAIVCVFGESTEYGNNMFAHALIQNLCPLMSALVMSAHVHAFVLVSGFVMEGVCRQPVFS